MKTQLITSIKILGIMILLLGIIYPMTVTGFAQLLFHNKANGSIITDGNNVKGSVLIGQQFDKAGYFYSRPSATAYNPMPSGASNFGLTNKKLWEVANERKLQFIEANKLKENEKVPSEMIFASASGLDPHISPEAALLQVNRIAETRSFTEQQKQELISLVGRLTETPQFHLFGKLRINVLRLNMEVDKIVQHPND